jgi:GNAT superfamily N-acetyltransferase
MLIRDFTLSDVPEMIELGRKMQEESSFDGLDYDFDKLMALGETYIANPEVYYAKVVTHNGVIYAMYVGYISEYYFSKDLAAFDLLLFVHPDKRGGLAAVRLIKDFEQWAYENNAKEIRPACSTGVKSEMTRQLYESLGYETVGYTFRKRR